jgi:hypothetical protein
MNYIKAPAEGCDKNHRILSLTGFELPSYYLNRIQLFVMAFYFFIKMNVIEVKEGKQ